MIRRLPSDVRTMTPAFDVCALYKSTIDIDIMVVVVVVSDDC